MHFIGITVMVFQKFAEMVGLPDAKESSGLSVSRTPMFKMIET